MPTSDTEIHDAFRRVYSRMIDDAPAAPEWEEVSAPTIGTTTAGGQKRRAGWLVAGAAAVLVLVVLGGALWLLGPGTGETGGVGPGTTSPTTTLPAAVPRMTVVFAPGEITEADWDAFIAVLGHYRSANGYFFVEQSTAYEQALSLFADDTVALDVLQEYPGIASGYAQVDFALADDAFAFQEEVTSLQFVVTAIGSNGPRLGRGYGTSPDLSVEADDVRARFWQFAHRSTSPPPLEQDPTAREATIVPEGHAAVALAGLGSVDEASTAAQEKGINFVCGTFRVPGLSDPAYTSACMVSDQGTVAVIAFDSTADMTYVLSGPALGSVTVPVDATDVYGVETTPGRFTLSVMRDGSVVGTVFFYG